jgi:putative heme-binding domain-containing protein
MKRIFTRLVCVLFTLPFTWLLTASASAQSMAGHTFSSADIAAGTRVYVRVCTLCHGPDGSWVPEINLAQGKFRTAVSDTDLARVIREGAGDGRMPAFNLNDEEMTAIIAYIRTGFDPEGESIVVGDTSSGLTLFNGKGECASCHRVNGVGPRTAPDLSSVGITRTPAFLLRTLENPPKGLMPINRPITLITREGESIRGRRLNEDTYTVQLIDSKERLLSFTKADLRSYEVSSKPTHDPTTLSDAEVADVLGYLLSLQGE